MIELKKYCKEISCLRLVLKFELHSLNLVFNYLLQISIEDISKVLSVNAVFAVQGLHGSQMRLLW